MQRKYEEIDIQKQLFDATSANDLDEVMRISKHNVEFYDALIESLNCGFQEVSVWLLLNHKDDVYNTSEFNATEAYFSCAFWQAFHFCEYEFKGVLVQELIQNKDKINAGVLLDIYKHYSDPHYNEDLHNKPDFYLYLQFIEQFIKFKGGQFQNMTQVPELSLT